VTAGDGSASAPITSLPWSARIFAAAPSPLAATLSVAAAYVLLWILFGALLPPQPGGRPLWGADSWTEAVVRGLMLGYLPALVLASRRAALRALAGLAPALRAGPGACDALARDLAPPRRGLRLAGGAGLLLLPVFGVLFFPAGGEGALRAARTSWNVLHFAAVGWLTFRAVVHDVHVAHVFSRVGARELVIDLADLAPVRPITWWALRAVLLWVVYISVISLFVLGPGPANPANASGIVPLLVVSFAALLLPVRGLRQRIRAEKRSELAWLDGEIRRERDLLRAGREPPRGARLANLVAWRSRIEAVWDWPYDASSLLRFALYTAVGLGSWLGGALVERLLDTALR
jgi:hypothetical protein